MNTRENRLYRPNARGRDLPIDWRIRGLEQRPLVGDPEAYVSHLEDVGFTVSTIGAMNGLGFAGYDTSRLPQVEGMDPQWIPGVLARAHDAGITLICWNVYNAQDVRNVDDFQIAKRYPQWTMQYIQEGGAEEGEKVGMCVLSSPYLAEHVKVLEEIVKLGPDAMWFDGFYLGGIPHPIRPGCVCEHCRRKFRSDYGLEIPSRVDWSDPTFKRWVRWRNERLVDGARYVTEKLHAARPGLPVTFNYNHWPFGSKDWANAIPLWSTRDYGVSQHAYSPDETLQWVMLGYKAQLSHDLNPEYSDIWRTGRPIFEMDSSNEATRKHELQIRLFTLAALSAGTIPWRSSHQFAEIQKRNNAELEKREHSFAKLKLAPIGVVISQNTHDFWGHIPGTDNLTDYRDSILGTWLLLTEHHLPFRFLFDNDLHAGALADLDTIVLPSTACVSEEQSDALGSWVESGGRLVACGPVGNHDEWGEPLDANRLAGVALLTIAEDPGRVYGRDRSAAAADDLLNALSSTPLPFAVEAPKSLACSLFRRDENTYVMHLLNVSAFYRYPNGCGFRGLGADSDAAATRGFETVPAGGVRVRLHDLNVETVQTVVGGTTLALGADGWIDVPPVAEHEALLITVG